MKIALGSDHRGVQFKENLKKALARRGIETEDMGPSDETSVDYPDFARKVALRVSQGAVDQGILVCSTGTGMTVSANKMPKIRAALCLNPQMAKQARGHVNANVLVFGADLTPDEDVEPILDAWLKSEFEGSVRHKRRIKKTGSLSASVAQPMALYDRDPDICAAVQDEARRQERTLNMIASESFVSLAVREAQGSVLTHKYAEGYPGKRWYQGCRYIDEVEQLAIDRLKQIFGAEHANVQPHSGSSANMAVYFSLLKPGDTMLAMNLSDGGHLTHGHEASFSGRLYNVVSYGVDKKTEELDYDNIVALAKEHKPRLIVCGSSAYSRIIDFKRLRKAADAVGAYLMADIAHIAGLVAARCHPDPVPFCEFVTGTTHKTLCGPRGGFILCQKRFAGDIDRQVFPGIQGGPLMHVIAAKAVCFHEAMRPAFQKYQEQIVRNSRALAATLANCGLRIVSGGTDNHLMLVDLSRTKVSGKDAAVALEQAGIVANKNAIPFDKSGPAITGGIRLGTPSVTARGMKEPEMEALGKLIANVVKDAGNATVIEKTRSAVDDLVEQFPVPD